MRPVPKSQPGPILDMRETGRTFYFILIYSEKNVQDEEASGEFPMGRRDIPARRDTLHHPSQQDPTRDLSVSPPRAEGKPVCSSLHWFLMPSCGPGRLYKGLCGTYFWVGRKLQLKTGPGPITLSRPHSWRVFSTTSSHACLGMAVLNTSRELGYLIPSHFKLLWGKVPHPSIPPREWGEMSREGSPQFQPQPSPDVVIALCPHRSGSGGPLLFLPLPT